MAVDGTRGGLRLASPATANVLGIAGMALFLASGPLEVLSHYATLSDAGWSGVVVLYASYVVGWVVARRQPRNPVGWILLGFAVLLGGRRLRGQSIRCSSTVSGTARCRSARSRCC